MIFALFSYGKGNCVVPHASTAMWHANVYVRLLLLLLIIVKAFLLPKIPPTCDIMTVIFSAH